ncbi:MAG: HAD family hydrolase [Longimicrobiales bacterium]
MQPKGLLLDFGGTLVEEVSFNPRAGNEWMLSRASHRPAHVTLDQIVDRAVRITSETAARRDQFQVETPWPMLTRLIYDPFGVRFADPLPELELGFWQASVVTRPMPGVHAALDLIHQAGLPIAVLCNASFGEHVIRHELAKHGLADHLECIIVSADYCVRKPNVLLFEVAAARLGLSPRHIWFVGDRFDTDITGAKVAGMTAVWFGQNTKPSSGVPGADLIVADWNEFAHQFQEISSARASM